MFDKASLHFETFRLILTSKDFFILTLSPSTYQAIQEYSDEESDEP